MKKHAWHLDIMHNAQFIVEHVVPGIQVMFNRAVWLSRKKGSRWQPDRTGNKYSSWSIFDLITVLYYHLFTCNMSMLKCWEARPLPPLLSMP